ncbi:PAS domain S-box [Candidatus Methanoperedens nitroreducens]|uniref:histidine kinase n=1 Tax=Candidatus Methanoperedens nitratireducens TaxID=1392998 RepID=A0A062V8D0_9EURY|nr:PAS domain S-box protein [Candidatus Methanoperedens nitroreducens]KCZ72009.1 PAS domain S-box [Candidatus Methanoperedens nitroreducens]MDJ1422014.1 PAS domain S-box protein [Candidatus Methanoperedens sp.]
MNDPLNELRIQYTSTLQDYLEGGGEAALEHAYELGRKAIAEGLGVLDIASVHHDAMTGLLQYASPESAHITKRAAEFFAESIAPFEMTFRGFQESIAKLRDLNMALERSEKRFRSVVQAASDAIISTDSSGNIISWNRGAQVVFGYSEEEVLGKSLIILMPERYRDAYLRKLEQARSTRESKIIGRTFESHGLRKDGGEFPLELSIASWKTEEGIFYTGIVRDITERKQAEEALHRARDELELRVQERTRELARANESLQAEIKERRRAEEELRRRTEDLARANAELEQFAYIAAHDLQEPLRMISIFTQLLAKHYKGRLDKDADEFITYVVDGARHMQQMIEDLLTYSRVGTSGKPFKPTNCEAVFYQAVANLKMAIEENRAEVTHDPLPTVIVDTSQMIELFQNLISNAIKFRREELPRIHVLAKKQESEWIFSVKDNGIGISPEFMGQLFKIFQREYVAKYPGTGVGLAICRRIVERHGGRIWAESEPGKGSTFYFTIPVRSIQVVPM